MTPVADLVTRAPFSTLFPRSETVLATLTKSMKETGYNVGHPIHVWTDAPDGYVVIDGHHRLGAARAAGLEEIEVHRVYFTCEKDALEYAIAQQRDRRNMTPEELAAHVARATAALDRPKAERQATKAKNARKNERSRDLSISAAPDGPEKTPVARSSAEDVAKLVGTSPATVKRIRAVLDSGDEETKKQLLEGKISAKAGAKNVSEKKTTKRKAEGKTKGARIGGRITAAVEKLEEVGRVLDEIPPATALSNTDARTMHRLVGGLDRLTKYGNPPEASAVFAASLASIAKSDDETFKAKYTEAENEMVGVFLAIVTLTDRAESLGIKRRLRIEEWTVLPFLMPSERKGAA